MGRKLRLRVSKNPILSISRIVTPPERTAYLAIASRPLRYRYGRSRIAYVGTTRAGIRRVAASAAGKAPAILNAPGVKRVDFYAVTCRPGPQGRIWKNLERGLLLVFRELYGEIPHYNAKSRRMKWGAERKYFSRSFLERVILQFAK